ncbi:MAG TPA: nucleotidyltransferase domain-containing protein [Xanthobacteraceae bacterium]|nr:nucleotidyltransferase domain-containing protein [Xanthobacteraceae bacterium]
MTTAIERAKEHSESKLNELRTKLTKIVPPGNIVVTCGSYARREASAESDIDFFIIANGHPAVAPWLEEVRAAISEIVPVEPAEGGAFSSLEARDDMLHNIGGDNDSNHKITRRMLFLLEEEWLFDAAEMKSFRRQILERYIGEGMTDHQLALFLLNDVIRYYRTMAVDYEFKTAEGETPKPWGIRNIKLVFSRKLLYASGLFSVAMTVDRTREAKIATLEQLFDLPVIERMNQVCGKGAMEGVLGSYNHFLERLEDADVRNRLKVLQKDKRSDPLFRELKNEGHHFTRELLKLFERTFDSTHPIRRAVIF